MLELTRLRQDTDSVLAGLKKKRLPDAQAKLEAVLSADEHRRLTQGEHDRILASANEAAKRIGELMREGKKAEAEAAKSEAASGKERVQTLQVALREAEAETERLLVELPNLPQDRVPEGGGAAENVTVKEGGTIPTLAEGAKPHWELIVDYSLVSFDLGNKITGAGFPVYTGQGARLQRKLIQFFLDRAVEAGYSETQPPILVNEASAYATGQLPDKEGQMYHASVDNLYLIPTAEVPLTNLYRDVLLADADLPIKLAGHTPCFRREAGSWGADVRGLNRLHQFDKVEIVQLRRPEESNEALEEMASHVEGLLTSLELPWRKLLLCGGDMGFTSAITYDYEVYSAAQGRWLEVSSVSNFETYQANRLKLRYKDEDKKTRLVHTLNGSALALPRILAALLENGQTPEGIRLPGVLAQAMGMPLLRP